MSTNVIPSLNQKTKDALKKALQNSAKLAQFSVSGRDYILHTFPDPALASLVAITIAGAVFKKLGLDPEKLDVVQTMKNLPVASMEQLSQESSNECDCDNCREKLDPLGNDSNQVGHPPILL